MTVVTVKEDGKVVRTMEDTNQQNSIELSKNAKGEWASKVKVYQDDPEIAASDLERYLDVVDKEIAKRKGGN